MESRHKANRHMFVGGAVFIGIGLYMIIQGIAHTMSGEPIPATSWTDESTGPEALVFGCIGVGLGVLAIRLGLRDDLPPSDAS